MFEYLKQHSKPLDLNTLQTALYKVMPYFSNTKKDESSLLAKDMIDWSIHYSKIAYTDEKCTNDLYLCNHEENEDEDYDYFDKGKE